MEPQDAAQWIELYNHLLANARLRQRALESASVAGVASHVAKSELILLHEQIARFNTGLRFWELQRLHPDASLRADRLERAYIRASRSFQQTKRALTEFKAAQAPSHTAESRREMYRRLMDDLSEFAGDLQAVRHELRPATRAERVPTPPREPPVGNGQSAAAVLPGVGGLVRTDRPIRLVCFGQFLVRQGVAAAVRSDDRIVVTGAAYDADAVRALIEQEDPEVVIIDVNLPLSRWEDSTRLAEWLTGHRRETGVILLTQRVEPVCALRLLARGGSGRGYMLHEQILGREGLESAVRDVAAGGTVVGTDVLQTILRMVDAKGPPVISSLTSRERRILAGVAEGESNRSIAIALQLTDETVEKHLDSAFEKLGLIDETAVNRRVQAALICRPQTLPAPESLPHVSRRQQSRG